MAQNTTAQQIEKAIESLVNKITPDTKKIAELNEKILDSMKALASLTDAYEELTGRIPPNLPMGLQKTALSEINPSSKIGDALYAILKASPAPLDKNDIIEKLRMANIRISMKNPRNVLNTAIKNDRQKRFEILDDGRVDLVYHGSERAIRSNRHAE